MLKDTLNKGISTPIAIGIVLILVILVGSFTWWQYGEMWRETGELPEIELPEKEETKGETVNQEGLVFTIFFDKEEYEIGEPIYLTAMLENFYKEPVKVGQFSLETGNLNFEINTPDEKSISYIGPIVMFSGAFTINPGEKIQAEYNFLDGKFGWNNHYTHVYNFTTKGEYSVMGKYDSFATTENVSRMNLTSNIESFIIK